MIGYRYGLMIDCLCKRGFGWSWMCRCFGGFMGLIDEVGSGLVDSGVMIVGLICSVGCLADDYRRCC
jgi:hypothetical protein